MIAKARTRHRRVPRAATSARLALIVSMLNNRSGQISTKSITIEEDEIAVDRRAAAVVVAAQETDGGVIVAASAERLKDLNTRRHRGGSPGSSPNDSSMAQ